MGGAREAGAGRVEVARATWVVQETALDLIKTAMGPTLGDLVGLNHSALHLLTLSARPGARSCLPSFHPHDGLDVRLFALIRLRVCGEERLGGLAVACTCPRREPRRIPGWWIPHHPSHLVEVLVQVVIHEVWASAPSRLCATSAALADDLARTKIVRPTPPIATALFSAIATRLP